MDSNKLADLRGHTQFLSGRLDTVQWCYNELGLTDEQKEKLRAYEKRNRESAREYQGKIDEINEAAAAKREETKRKKAEDAAKRKQAYA